MQSQFGRDVLGVVRLDEARRLKAKEKEILADISDDTDKETMKSLKQEAKMEKQEYSQLKKLRWPLLINLDKLSDSKTEYHIAGDNESVPSDIQPFNSEKIFYCISVQILVSTLFSVYPQHTVTDADMRLNVLWTVLLQLQLFA